MIFIIIIINMSVGVIIMIQINSQVATSTSNRISTLKYEYCIFFFADGCLFLHSRLWHTAASVAATNNGHRHEYVCLVIYFGGILWKTLYVIFMDRVMVYLIAGWRCILRRSERKYILNISLWNLFLLYILCWKYCVSVRKIRRANKLFCEIILSFSCMLLSRGSRFGWFIDIFLVFLRVMANCFTLVLQ